MHEFQGFERNAWTSLLIHVERRKMMKIQVMLKIVDECWNHVNLKVGDEWIVVNSATQSLVRTKLRNGWYKSTKPWEYRYPLIWSMKLSESWIHLCFLSWNMKNCVASMNESWWIIVKMNSKLMNPSWKMVIWTKNDENQEMYPRFDESWWDGEMQGKLIRIH